MKPKNVIAALAFSALTIIVSAVAFIAISIFLLTVFMKVYEANVHPSSQNTSSVR